MNEKPLNPILTCMGADPKYIIERVYEKNLENIEQGRHNYSYYLGENMN